MFATQTSTKNKIKKKHKKQAKIYKKNRNDNTLPISSIGNHKTKTTNIYFPTIILSIGKYVTKFKF